MRSRKGLTISDVFVCLLWVVTFLADSFLGVFLIQETGKRVAMLHVQLGNKVRRFKKVIEGWERRTMTGCYNSRSCLSRLPTAGEQMKKKDALTILSVGTVFGIGIFLRVWYFGAHPAGLHQDEASIAVEASSLYYFGSDRNGQTYPVHFISWGSGQNALYAYLLIPLVPLGLSPEVIRLPMLITGLMSIPLMYFIGRKIFSPSVGMLAAMLMAISPWHIMLSRWALESNILPFVFLLGFCCIINFDRGWLWMVAGFIFLGISLYAYGTAYFLVPLFLLLFLAILLPQRRFAWWQVGMGLLVFFLIALPIGLFIVINSFSLPAMRLGVISIPRLPADPRYAVLTGVGGGNALIFYGKNFYAFIRILFLQTDDLVFNSLPASGFLFPGSIFFALFGIGRILHEWKIVRSPQLLLFLGWVGFASLLGIAQPPVINRINVLFPGLILLVAWVFEGLWRHSKAIFWSVALGLTISTFIFAREYFQKAYRNEVGRAFADGLILALQQIPSQADIPVCITGQVNMPYIFVLLVHPQDPSFIAEQIHYVTQRDAFRVVDRYENYYFGFSNCPSANRLYIIAVHGEKIPLDRMASFYSVEEYGNFDLYIPMNIREENR
jgi:4-amino-4-deoxy-L-arabinose transferase-like glycosyltransferase